MKNVMNTYSRLPIRLVRGSGCTVWDEQGNEYLDMVAGIAVCNLGHCHPAVVKALQDQAQNLFHCSNLYEIPQQERLAGMIVEQSFDGEAFFCNSGAEANEAAIKLARRYSNEISGRGSRIISARGSFHGRTLATVAATGQDKFKRGFDPIPNGFVYADYGDARALEAAIDDTVGAVLLEPIQGESGVHVPAPGYLEEVRRICDENNLVMILDEVQTGMARTGAMFGYQHTGVVPDVMSMAKALGNGFPVGAVVACPEVARAFTPGTHASTFGGNPLAMAACIATMETMVKEQIPRKSLQQGVYLRDRLEELKRRHACINDVRGKGLMVGTEFSEDVSFLVEEGIKRGVLVNVIKGRILRLVPPLVISIKEIDRFAQLLDEMLCEKGL